MRLFFKGKSSNLASLFQIQFPTKLWLESRDFFTRIVTPKYLVVLVLFVDLIFTFWQRLNHGVI